MLAGLRDPASHSGFQILRCSFAGSMVNVRSIDVNKIRPRARLRNRLGRGDKRVRHRQHDVARLNPRAVNANRSASVPLLTPTQYLRIAKLGKFPLESFYRRPADKTGRLERHL